jgi:hypothetical protein
MGNTLERRWAKMAEMGNDVKETVAKIATIVVAE